MKDLLMERGGTANLFLRNFDSECLVCQKTQQTKPWTTCFHIHLQCTLEGPIFPLSNKKSFLSLGLCLPHLSLTLPSPYKQ